eukprot:TRINITY_DN18863_c0_g1_i1.p1 TRINITY_DN18863_c0_g1~~TRINITY_DN18863_c0_g1_i1.p1  ORF type:complete len:255 (+),score=54.62 TRINITY_DN18863_c0_g1_i1:87-851(+)
MPGDVMDEIRAQARAVGQERERKLQAARTQQDIFKQMDASPTSGDDLPDAQAFGRLPGDPSADSPLMDTGTPRQCRDGVELGSSGGFPLGMCGASPANPCMQVYALAGWRLPANESFDGFFRRWFVNEYFPELSRGLQQELQRRSKSKGFFSGLASQVRGWAMKNSGDEIQADVWYMYTVKHAPPQFSNYFCFRTASVNLGSQAHPCWATFLGLPASTDKWELAPWASTDADYASLLDELDDRGGEAALVSAAA